MPGLPQSGFWHDSRSTFSLDLAQVCCAFTGISLEKLKGRNRNWELSCSFQKYFSSRFVFILLYPIARGKLLDAESDSKGSYNLAFIKLCCELGHMAQKCNRETVKGFLQASRSLSVTTVVELLPFYGAGMLRCCAEKSSAGVWTGLN